MRMKINNEIVILFTHLHGLDFFTVMIHETRHHKNQVFKLYLRPYVLGRYLHTSPNAREDLIRKTFVRGLELYVF